MKPFVYVAEVHWWFDGELSKNICLGYCESMTDAMQEIEFDIYDNIEKVEVQLIDTTLGKFPVSMKESIEKVLKE